MSIRSTLRNAVTATFVATVFVAGCGKSDSSTDAAKPAEGGKKQIAVIAKSTVNSYWKAVEAGARQAAGEEGVEINWTGPDAETNHTQQANMVDNMVNSGVAGVVLAPTNVDALVRPVDSAVAKGIPVVLIDSSLNTKTPKSSIATDNYQAGRQAADALVAAIGDKKPFGGKVIMLRFLEGSGSTERREKGFADRIKEVGLTLADNAYTKGGGSTTDAADTADALLRRCTKDGQVQVDGIFAANQPTAIGMLRKIEQFTAQGTKIEAPFVGFDAHEVLLAGVRSGKVAAIVTQDPKQMGYLGVKTMARIVRGESVEAEVSTATATVTKANIDDPKIKAVTLE
ncbi:MAG TPA: substrate-binding domain-containing protein [Tepidisphaeraceae bacterium]